MDIYKKRTTGFIVLLTLIFGYVVVSSISSSRHSATITTEIIPSNTTVKLNGKGIRNGKHKVTPGTYKLLATREGFKTEEREVTVRADEERYVGIALQSNSEDTSDWYTKNKSDRIKAEGIASNNFDQNNSEQAQLNPLFQQLPVSWNHGMTSIGIGPSSRRENQTAVIIQEDSTVGRSSLIKWIRDQGYNPGDYEIEFTDYINPALED